MRYPSSITFLYYNDLDYGAHFIESVLQVPMIMDQGFAKVYQLSTTSYLGIVQKKEASPYNGDTLISLNTDDVAQEYKRVKELDVKALKDITSFPSIPLRSFFFQDDEGHRFEIQEFIDQQDRERFLM